MALLKMIIVIFLVAFNSQVDSQALSPGTFVAAVAGAANSTFITSSSPSSFASFYSFSFSWALLLTLISGPINPPPPPPPANTITITPGVTSCSAYTPVSSNWNAFSGKCYVQQASVVTGGVAPYNCAYLINNPKGTIAATNGNLYFAGNAQNTYTPTSSGVSQTTNFVWIQPVNGSASVVYINSNTLQQSENVIIASTSDGYAMISCPVQTPKVCSLPQYMIACTYARVATQAQLDGIQTAVTAAGINSCSFKPVDQSVATCGNNL